MAQFLFRMLDFKKQGYLDAFVINYFFREIHEKMVAMGHDAANAADVKVPPCPPVSVSLCVRWLWLHMHTSSWPRDTVVTDVPCSSRTRSMTWCTLRTR